MNALENLLKLVSRDTTGIGDKRILVTYLAQYEINSSINLALGRIESGAEIQEAFIWLAEDIERIYNGEQPTED